MVVGETYDFDKTDIFCDDSVVGFYFAQDTLRVLLTNDLTMVI